MYTAATEVHTAIKYPVPILYSSNPRVTPAPGDPIPLISLGTGIHAHIPLPHICYCNLKQKSTKSMASKTHSEVLDPHDLIPMIYRLLNSKNQKMKPLCEYTIILPIFCGSCQCMSCRKKIEEILYVVS